MNSLDKYLQVDRQLTEATQKKVEPCNERPSVEQVLKRYFVLCAGPTSPTPAAIWCFSTPFDIPLSGFFHVLAISLSNG
jgi:hypothetical protein